MKVLVLKKAFCNGYVVRVGEIIDYKGNKVPSWGKKIENTKEHKTPKEPQTPKNQNPQNQKKETESETVIVAGDGGIHTIKDSEVDEFANKTEEEILAELDSLITKGIEKNIMLEDAENKTPKEQIIELRELLKGDK